MTARVMFMPRYLAWCDECAYDGPAQAIEADAQKDADRHNEEVHRVPDVLSLFTQAARAASSAAKAQNALRKTFENQSSSDREVHGDE